MKRQAMSAAVVCVALVLFAAGAQAEQWLQYRSAKEPYQLTGVYTAGQSAGVTPEAPKDAALPPFTGKPVFGRWVTPMAKDGYLLVALDQSKAGGPHDRLYIDADGDGRLAGETSVSAWPTEREGMPEGYEYVQFGPVKVLFKGDDGPITYHVIVTFYSYKERTSLYVRSAGWYEGKIRIGDREYVCRLFDYNGNGAFNDASTKTRDADLLSLDVKGDGKFVQFFMGKYLQPVAPGPYYLLTAARDGACVTIAPAGEVPVGTVGLPKDTGFVELVGENGHFRRHAKDGPVQVPPGVYGLKYIDFKRNDDKGVPWELMGDAFPESLVFEVKPGETAAVAVGEPIVSTLTMQKSDGTYYFSQSLKGANVEHVTLQRSGEQAPPPQVRIRNADGSYDRLASLQYG